jgi:hypothetical protein
MIATTKKCMNTLPLSFLFILATLLFGCVPVCSSKRRLFRGGTGRILRPPSPANDAAQNAPGPKPPVRSGDIIFIAIPNPLFRHVADATGCPANHVGIVFDDPSRGWVVAESAVPISKTTPLEKFIARSNNGWCVIRRLKSGVKESQVQTLRAECDARMGVVYHPGFRYESRRLFCSKFVYDVCWNALGVSVGKIETFSALLSHTPTAGLTFWKCWFFGRIPWNRLTVTPASQFESDLLETVWQSNA